MIFDLFRNMDMRRVRLTDDQRASRIFINAVYDTRTHDTVNPTQFTAAMVHDRIHQGS